MPRVMHTADVDVMTDRDEQFRQFQADRLERQTVALERTARYVSEIRTVIEVFFGLVILAAVVLFVLAAH